MGGCPLYFFKVNQRRACNVVQCPQYPVKVGQGRKYVIITVESNRRHHLPFKRYFRFRFCWPSYRSSDNSVVSTLGIVTNVGIVLPLNNYFCGQLALMRLYPAVMVASAFSRGPYLALPGPDLGMVKVCYCTWASSTTTLGHVSTKMSTIASPPAHERN